MNELESTFFLVQNLEVGIVALKSDKTIPLSVVLLFRYGSRKKLGRGCGK